MQYQDLFIRAANESISSKLGLAQTRLIKIRVKSSRVELVKYFELKGLAQTQLVTIRASSRANACTLTQFDIYI
jgi:hypothetical protein